MNADLLVQHFNRISEAPDAVARLRRFILDLAVRGKLVEQDPKDEPAAKLLKRIQAEKARLVKAGTARLEKSSVPLEPDQLPFPVPVGWRWSQLIEVGIISPRNDVDGATQTSFVPMTLIPADYGIAHKHEIRQWNEIRTGYTHFAEGDVGLAKITPCFENGKSTVFRNLAGGVGAGTTELHIVRPLLIDADYVLLFLKCPFFIESGIPRMTGTAGQKRVPAGYFSQSPFPLPPRAEQRRIVAKVDELMALCDQLEAAKTEREARRHRLVAASLHRIGTAPADELPEAARFHLAHLPRLSTRIEHIKELRKAILDLAVRGRLVAQDPKEKPASASVDLVGNEANKAIAKGVIRWHDRAALGDDSGLPVLPIGWRWSRLLEVTRPVPYAIKRGPFGSAIRKDMFVPAGFKIYEQQHAISGDFTKGRYYIAKAKFEELRAFELHPNEILVSCSGTVGKVAIVPEDIERGIINQALLKLSLHQSALLNEYFLILFPAFFMETDTLTDLQGTAQKNIPGVAILKEMPFPLPPLAEQRRIVAKVDELMALCDKLEAQLTATQAESRHLLEAVLRDTLAPALAKAA